MITRRKQVHHCHCFVCFLFVYLLVSNEFLGRSSCARVCLLGDLSPHTFCAHTLSLFLFRRRTSTHCAFSLWPCFIVAKLHLLVKICLILAINYTVRSHMLLHISLSRTYSLANTKNTPLTLLSNSLSSSIINHCNNITSNGMDINSLSPSY